MFGIKILILYQAKFVCYQIFAYNYQKIAKNWASIYNLLNEYDALFSIFLKLSVGMNRFNIMF
jgi:hypothetical protein